MFQALREGDERGGERQWGRERSRRKSERKEASEAHHDIVGDLENESPVNGAEFDVVTGLYGSLKG